MTYIVNRQKRKIFVAQHAPGRHERKGLTSRDVFKMFPDTETAEEWFEEVLWKGHVVCGHCGSTDRAVGRESRKPMPYWCPDCKNYFSVRTGTVLARSKIKLEDWAFAIYLQASSLKGISSMKLHRELGITQKSAWFMAHRIREAYEAHSEFSGEVEMDEVYIGGLKRHKRGKAIEKMPHGTGGVGKTAVVGLKERDTGRIYAQVVPDAKRKTLHQIIEERVVHGSTMYTDEWIGYKKMPHHKHKTVRHGVREYVRGKVHVNGVESFWAVLQRAHMGVFHKLSPKHLQRYINEFYTRSNIRDLDTLDQMKHMVAMMIGKRLTYRNLKAPNGLDSMAQEATL